MSLVRGSNFGELRGESCALIFFVCEYNNMEAACVRVCCLAYCPPLTLPRVSLLSANRTSLDLARMLAGILLIRSTMSLRSESHAKGAVGLKRGGGGVDGWVGGGRGVGGGAGARFWFWPSASYTWVVS
jgi:hypothetical protein